jgi:hypothetical protein
MFLRTTAGSRDLHGRAFELLADLGPLRGRQRRLDAMCVRRPQLDAIEAGGGEVLDDRRNIPVLGDVVGDGPELDRVARPGGSSRLSVQAGWNEGRCRSHEAGGEKGAARRGAAGTDVSH